MAGAYSGEAKLVQTNAIARGSAAGIKAEYVTIGTQSELALSTSPSSGRIFKMASGAPATGQIVVFTKLNGKTVYGEAACGFTVGRPYWARNVSTTEFELAYTKAGAESSTTSEHEEISAEVKASETTVINVKEHTGVKTARQKTSFEAATNSTKGVSKDAAAREVEISANATKIKWVMYFSAVTSGEFCGCAEVTEKELGEGDIYRITEGKLEENAWA